MKAKKELILMVKVRTIKSAVFGTLVLITILGSMITQINAFDPGGGRGGDGYINVSGIVTDENNDALEGAKVEFLRDGYVVKVRRTNQVGEYSFSYYHEGMYIYTFRVSKYGYETANSVGPFRAGTYVYNFVLDFPGEHQFYIYGKVTNEDNNLLMNAKIEFLRDGQVVLYQNTNYTGQYAFNYEDDGSHTYALRVSKQDYQTETADGPTSPGYFNCDFDLEYSNFTLEIRGYVKYNSNDLVNATVELWRNTDTLVDLRRTDNNGYYEGRSFTYIPFHNYELRAFHPNFTIEVQPVEVETGPLLYLNFTFTIQDTMNRYVILLGINDFDSNGEKDINDFSDTHERILEWYECFREALGIPDENFEILTDRNVTDSIFDDTNQIDYKYYHSSYKDSTKWLTPSSTQAASWDNTTETLKDVLWDKAGVNDEVFICLISHGSNKSNDFELVLLDSENPSEPNRITGSDISYIIEHNECITEKIFVYTHACHGGKLGEILMDNPKKSSIYVATGCGAEGVVIYPFQKTLVTEIWEKEFKMFNRVSSTVAMETLFKEAIQYMYNNPGNFPINYSYFYNINNPSERIYTYTIDGTSYYGWNQSDFILNIPDEYSVPNGYSYNCSTFALNVTSGEYYFHLWDAGQGKHIWFFENYTRFEYLAEYGYGYLIRNNPCISITAIYIHGWEHLMPCEYDGDNQNCFY